MTIDVDMTILPHENMLNESNQHLGVKSTEMMKDYLN